MRRICVKRAGISRPTKFVILGARPFIWVSLKMGYTQFGIQLANSRHKDSEPIDFGFCNVQVPNNAPSPIIVPWRSHHTKQCQWGPGPGAMPRFCFGDSFNSCHWEENTLIKYSYSHGKKEQMSYHDISWQYFHKIFIHITSCPTQYCCSQRLFVI